MSEVNSEKPKVTRRSSLKCRRINAKPNPAPVGAVKKNGKRSSISWGQIDTFEFKEMKPKFQENTEINKEKTKEEEERHKKFLETRRRSISNEFISEKDMMKACINFIEEIFEEEKNKSSFIYNEANDKYSNNYSNYNMNKKSFDEVTKLSKESTKILSEYNEIESLYNVASGKISGNRVSFEVYYQLQIFEEILKFASYKFNKMTDGRYELLRGAPKGGNGQIGLEIDVRDLYNGEVRPVSGLSGGESFQASMSLALAFSEIIQMKAGGVELNSMFIDEGFGTLDNEMLDNTKKTLLEIGESTNRKIGIISHITELERSIPSKIIVTKSDKGSSFVIKNE